MTKSKRAIFRTLLTDMSDQNVSNEKFKNNPNDIIRTRTRYLTAEQVDILQNILSKEIDYYIELPEGRKEKHRRLLIDTELEGILNDSNSIR